ncbi:clathrin heavy chain linker domain-containing protein 1 [Callorhinchus milii]|nr:clathrin heavy chain linker domain-containing protein 1 [Callorhinchus milii]
MSSERESSPSPSPREGVSGPQPQPQLPVLSPNDQKLLSRLREHIRSEIEILGCPEQGPDEQRYILYKSVFEKVIENTKEYKNILTSIKKEYDDCIHAIQKGKKDALFLKRKLKSMAFEPTTLMSYKKRADLLRHKIDLIERNTAVIEAQLEKNKHSEQIEEEAVEEVSAPEEDSSLTQQIKGLSFHDSSNMTALCAYQQKLEKILESRKDAKETKFVSASVHAKMAQEMTEKVQIWEKLSDENGQLQIRYKKMKMLADAVTDWEKSDQKVTVTEFISPLLKTIDKLREDDHPWPMVFVDDDPNRFRELQLLLNYIEKFDELFLAKKYEEAAIHVANSPKRILHNIKTMERFKAVTDYEGKVPPLLLFFEAVMSSGPSGKRPPNSVISLEGVQCALNENKLDLVIHWVTRHRLTYSEALGEEICQYGDMQPQTLDTCLALAQTVFLHCAVHKKVALTMCKRGQSSAALSYISDCDSFTLNDSLFLLNEFPNVELIRNLVYNWKGKPATLSMDLVILSLISNENKEFAFQILKDLDDRGPNVLAETILRDVNSGLGNWKEIADECMAEHFTKMGQNIITVLLEQDGGTVVQMSDDADDSTLMDHVLL